MKKNYLIGAVVFVLVIGVAIYQAIQLGKPSPLYLQGKVKIEPSLESDAKGLRQVFVILRDADDPSPAPFGAMREMLSEDAHGEFLDLVVTPEKLMRMDPSRPEPRFFTVKVRIDTDGQAGSDQPGDLVGIAERVALASTNISITIDKKIPNP